LYENSSINVTVTKPLSLNAEYSKQYLVHINTFNGTGQRIYVNIFNSSLGVINSTPYLDSGATLYIYTAYYKRAYMPFNYSSSINGPKTINVTLPVYDVIIHIIIYLTIVVSIFL
jgi:hypothetical protein